MGTEGNNIDDLFREKLGARESFPGPEGWIEVERLINQKKKKRRGGFWLFWILLLSGISGFTFWYNMSSSKNIHPGATSSYIEPSKSGGVDSDVPITKPNEFESSDAITNRITKEENAVMSEKIQPSELPSSTQQKDILPKNSEKFNKSFNNTKEKGGDRAQTPKKTGTLSKSNNSASSFGKSSSIGLGEDKKDPMVIDPVLGELPVIFGFTQPGYLNYRNQNGIPNELTLVEPNLFEPSFIQPPFITTIPKTSIEGAINIAHTRSLFGPTSNSILMQRDEQEKPIISSGFDLMFTHRLHSLRYGIGLQYQNTGENVQYEAQIERDSITDNSYYEIIETYEQVIDSVFIGGQWVDDTLLVLIDIDSTFISDIDTSTFVFDDPTIGSNNGRTSIQTISIPIQFGYEWQRRNSSWYVYGSIDPTWIIKRTAYYLQSAANTRLDINQIDTYKKMTWRASLGVAWNRQLFEDKAYIIINPFSRFNITSWNRNYDHTYFDLGLRVGMGFWIR